MAEHIYKRPYLDSGVFIAWIKGEVITEKDSDGKPMIVDRGKIGEHVLTEAEQGQYLIIISALTFAEVHKKRGKEKLAEDENDNVLDYFEHDFVTTVPVDRGVGVEANRLCRKYEDKKLSPNDAIHLVCAKRAGCDVLLSWDEVLNSIRGEGIRIERPKIFVPPPPPEPEPPPIFKLLEESKANDDKGTAAPIPPSPELPGSSSGPAPSETGTKAAEAGTSGKATEKAGDRKS